MFLWSETSMEDFYNDVYITSHSVDCYRISIELIFHFVRLDVVDIELGYWPSFW